MRGWVCAFLSLMTATAVAMELRLDRRAIEEAIVTGQSALERERLRFHEPYRFHVSRAPVDYVDVVTPFRKVVIAAELRARQGDRRFGQADAIKLLEDTPLEVGVYIETTFHPLNAYVGVPDYSVKLIPAAGDPMMPVSFDRIPRFGPRLEGLPLPSPYPGPLPSRGRSVPMLGATVIATFDGKLIDPKGSYSLTMSEGEKELAQVKVEFARLR